MARALGTGIVGNSKLLQFDRRGAARPVTDPAWTICTAPLSVGTDLRSAKTINVTATARLQGFTVEDVTACGKISNTKKRALIAAATPPCFATLVATAAAPFVGAARLHADPPTSALVSSCAEFVQYIDATCEYISATARLSIDHDGNVDRAARECEEHFGIEPTEATAATTATTSAAPAQGRKPHPAVQYDEPGAKLWSNLTEEEQTDRRRRALEDEKNWQPNFTDLYPGSTADVLDLLNQTGLPARAAKGKLDNPVETLQFFQALITINFAAMDGIFRQAGPTRMELKISDVVRSRGYPMRDQAKFRAAKEIIDDLLDRGVIYENPNSAFSSPMLLVPKRCKPDETSVHKRWRQVCDYRALNAVTMSENYGPPAVNACINAIAGCKYKTLLDLEKGYWQLQIHPDCSDYTTFVVPCRPVIRY